MKFGSLLVASVFLSGLSLQAIEFAAVFSLHRYSYYFRCRGFAVQLLTQSARGRYLELSAATGMGPEPQPAAVFPFWYIIIWPVRLS